ncbi:MAG TPA: InlB B-repeat-containing protein [Clostridia bacterium]|jgi:hypothetical protein
MNTSQSSRPNKEKIIYWIVISLAVLFVLLQVFFPFIHSQTKQPSLPSSPPKNEPTEYSNDDFFYIYLDENHESIQITGLNTYSKLGQIVVVPQKIGGKRVVKIEGLKDNEYSWISYNLEKIFLEDNFEADKNPFKKCPRLKSVIIQNFERDENLPRGIMEWIDDERSCYIAADVYSSLDGDIKNYVKPGNVSFMLNYEDAPYFGVYWVDNVPYGEKISFTPKNPKRRGYRFKGWFKEPECVNDWTNDHSLPERVIDENGAEVFQELKLYAKWEKIEWIIV